ncbi:conserved Plasmodium protein, unknown function [Plasmodium malariae]|uniref:Uncharacterized protein n=2 Tax=Plasmodium (Plasmodium) TaxID=418103 RepID=A0A1D3JJG1_PLAMA|nr:conserved Plasmodium protein, unknown function [Plasmodium malariae]SBT86640.1 conserved Plasmodium protein, unknown function [Plasmodium malariae]
MYESSNNILSKSKELGEIFLKSLKNDGESVKYLNECKNCEISEFYGAFYLVFSNVINNDNNLIVFKDHLLFLSFCYMNKLLEKYYTIYTVEDKNNIRNNFINILFSLPIHFNHELDSSMLNIKEKSIGLIKKKFVQNFLNENSFLIRNYLTSLDNYFISSYMNSTRNKYSQILSILCMHNDYIYFRYVFNFILFFLSESLKRKLAPLGFNEVEKEEFKQLMSVNFMGNYGGGRENVLSSSNIRSIDNVNDNNNLMKQDEYFGSVLHICINFLKEIFYTISNENPSKVVNRQQLNIFRSIIINDVNELFNFFFISFYYCVYFNKKNEFELLLECVKELSFFFPAYIFFSESSSSIGSTPMGSSPSSSSSLVSPSLVSSSPIKFLLNILLVCFTKTSNGCVVKGQISPSGDNGSRNYISGVGKSSISSISSIALSDFCKLYKQYIPVNEFTCKCPCLYKLLDSVDIEEKLLVIFLNIVEYISRINNKTFFQLNEYELMQFLENYFNINLNLYDVNNYAFQNIYVRMILNLSRIPMSNYLHKKENKLRCFHIYIMNIFKNIYHPSLKILVNVLTICKNIFDYNRDLIYIKNKEHEGESDIFNMNKNDKESLLNENNEKRFNGNHFVITRNDLKKLIILLFVKIVKIPIYTTSTPLNKKLMVQFVSSYVEQYDDAWFDAYYRCVREYQEEVEGCIYNVSGVGSISSDNVVGSANGSGHIKNMLKNKIYGLLRTLIGMNHEVYHIMLEVFFDFFKFYDNINLSNLCSEVIKVKDYFIYILLRVYYQLLTFFINILKECKSVITDGDTEINRNIISFQLLSSVDGDLTSQQAYVRDKINLKTLLQKRIVEMQKEQDNENGVAGVKDMNEVNRVSSQSGIFPTPGKGVVVGDKEYNSDNINGLKKEIERIDLELHIIKCIEKYRGSPYYEICNKCIMNLLSCYKIILEKDFLNFAKFSSNFILFEIKRLEYISSSTYILNYNKDFAFLMIDHLVQNIVKNDMEYSYELKKNYVSIFTAVILNLEHFLSNEMIKNVLKTFIEYKKKTKNFFKYNKEFTILLLTLIYVLKVDYINGEFPNYINLVLDDTYEFLTSFNKTITSFYKLYELFYLSEHKTERVHSLFDVYKVVQNYFSLFSLRKFGCFVKNSKKEKNDSSCNNFFFMTNEKRPMEETHFSEETLFNHINNNTAMINENEFLQIAFNLFTSILCIYPLFNDMLNTSSITFENYPMLCSEVNYFHLNGKEREVLNNAHSQGCGSVVSGPVSSALNSGVVDGLEYHLRGGVPGDPSETHIRDRGRRKKSNCSIRLMHENVCTIIKKFISEGYIFMYNDIVDLFNNVLLIGLSYSPYYFLNENILYIYLCLSEKLKYVISNRIINKLLIHWYIKIYEPFFERKFHYFRAQFDHIKKVNNELNSQLNIKEEEYTIYYDMLYMNKHYILNYLKICKNIFVIPNDFKNTQERSKKFYHYIYDIDKVQLFNCFLPTIEFLLNSYDCNITRRCLSLLVDVSDSLIMLSNNSSCLCFAILQIIKTLLQSFFMYNPLILTLYQSKKEDDKRLTSRMYSDYTDEHMEVLYIGEMKLFMKEDPHELSSYLNVFTSTILKICKNYFILQKNIFSINTNNTSFSEIVNIESIKHFILLFERMDNSNAFDFQTILLDLFNQGTSDYLKNLLIQYRMHKMNK